MERHSAVLMAIISLMLIHFCHCKTNSNADNSDHHIDGTSNGFQLQTDIEVPLQSSSSSSSSSHVDQFNEEKEIIRLAKDSLLRSILKNAVIEVSRYLRVIDAAKHHNDMSSADETTFDAYAPARTALLGNEVPEQNGDGDDMLKRSPPAPLRKRQLNALERAVIRQEILRRLEENKNPLEIPIGLRFRRGRGEGVSPQPVVPIVNSFLPTRYRLGYGPQSLASRHSSSWSNSFPDMWK